MQIPNLVFIELNSCTCEMS